METLEYKLNKHKIRALKFNQSLDLHDKNQNSFESLIQLSKDRKEMLIVKKKPNPNTQYVVGIDTVQLSRIAVKIKIGGLKERLRPHIGHKIRDKLAITKFNQIDAFVDSEVKTHTELKSVYSYLVSLMQRYDIRTNEPNINESESEDDLEELLDLQLSLR